VSEVKFIFAYIIFLVFVTQMTSLGAPSFFEQTDVELPTAPNCQIGTGGWYDVPVIAQAKILLDLLLCAWNNFTYFFTLMSYSSSVAFLGVILVIPFIVTLFWLIGNWLRGR